MTEYCCRALPGKDWKVSKKDIGTPWRAEVCKDRGPVVVDQSGVLIGICGTWSLKDNRAQAEARFAGNVENTRRIAASVNALQHVSIEQLESGEVFSLAQRLADAERERDLLLAALCEVERDIEHLRLSHFVDLEKVSAELAAAKSGIDNRPRYTSVSKGGSYTKLGAIRGAGSFKGLAGIAYQNDKGDLFIREPECFAKRMVLVEKLAQGGDA